MLDPKQYLQSLFICSVTCILSFCCNARSPASVGVYAYSAEQISTTCGVGTYAGGGNGARLGVVKLAFSFMLKFENWFAGVGTGAGVGD